MQKALLLLFIPFISCFTYSQGIEDYLGESKKTISILKDNAKYENILTGNFYSLTFMLRDKTSMIQGMKFEFDENVQTVETPCIAVIVYFLKAELENIKLKLASDYPFYDELRKTYHDGKIGVAILDNTESDILTNIMYFNYEKHVKQ